MEDDLGDAPAEDIPDLDRADAAGENDSIGGGLVRLCKTSGAAASASAEASLPAGGRGISPRSGDSRCLVVPRGDEGGVDTPGLVGWLESVGAWPSTLTFTAGAAGAASAGSAMVAGASPLMIAEDTAINVHVPSRGLKILALAHT